MIYKYLYIIIEFLIKRCKKYFNNSKFIIKNRIVKWIKYKIKWRIKLKNSNYNRVI